MSSKETNLCAHSEASKTGSAENVITLASVSKCYRIFEKPHHRLLQGIFRKRKYYDEFWALENINIDITKGEVVGIIGRNGAGKSTLLQILAGTLAPTGGAIGINGRVTALLELGAGFNPEFTGRENITLNAALFGLSNGEIEEKLEQIISFADIGQFLDQPVKTYSSGMHVRLAFAIQANLDPDIFIVDEALAVGDANFVHKCMLRFEQLKNKGTTILLVTHDATAVRTLCSRAIWIDQGTVRMDNTPSVVVDDYLAEVSKQPKHKHFNQTKTSTVLNSLSQITDSPAKVEIEKEIPNIDKRYGDQRCYFVGASLYNGSNQKVTSLMNNSRVSLRVSFLNNSLKSSDKLIFGFSLRNCRGVDIASNNTEIDEFAIVPPGIGSYATVKTTMTLPLLHPGSYAFNISLNYRDSDGNMENADAIHNALIFEIASSRKIHVLMSLKTHYEVQC